MIRHTYTPLWRLAVAPTSLPGPGRFRYRITPLGRTVAVLFLKTYTPLPTAWRPFNRTLDDFIDHQLAAAA